MIRHTVAFLRRVTHFRIRSLILLTVTVAVFFAGYRSGWQKSDARRFAKFEELIALIESTVVPSKWEALGQLSVSPNPVLESNSTTCVTMPHEEPEEKSKTGESNGD